MKRAIFTALILVCVLLVSCAGGAEGEPSSQPPAFDILERQATLTKHGKKGESASFSAEEFKSLLGESVSSITLKSLPEATAGRLIFNGEAVTEGQAIALEEVERLRFIPSAETKSASFCFSCDSAGFENRDIKCSLVFSLGVNSPPIAEGGSMSTVSGISCEGFLSINEPDGDGYTIKVITYPRNGEVSVSAGGLVVYTPKDSFSGIDTLVYSVSDVYGAASQPATLKIEVKKNESGLYFADMQDNENHLYAHRMCESAVMVYKSEGGKYLFEPSQEVTKLEFLVMLMSASGQDKSVVAVADSAIGDDSGLSSGLKGYLSTAAEKQIIMLENGNFSPNSPISVQDACYMVARVLGLPGSKSENASATANEEYSAAMLAVNGAKLLDVVEPEKTLNKAEVAELLCRAQDYMLANNMPVFRD